MAAKNLLYGTLSGSHGRPFRISHEKGRVVLPGGEITVMSYAVGNKTSLSLKQCISDIVTIELLHVVLVAM